METTGIRYMTKTIFFICKSCYFNFPMEDIEHSRIIPSNKHTLPFLEEAIQIICQRYPSIYIFYLNSCF